MKSSNQSMPQKNLITKHIVLKWSGLGVSILFFIACINPYITPEYFFIGTFFAILFPYFFIAFLLWLIVAFIYFKRAFWLYLLLIIPAWNNIRVVFSLHPSNNNLHQKKSGNLRVLSWNVNSFLYGDYRKAYFHEKQDSMLSFIQKTNADVLCFQDYSEVPPFFGKANIRFIKDSLKYPYYYFSDDCLTYGTIIFSRLPIIDSGHIKYSGKGYTESLAFVRIPFENDTIKIFNTHFRSMFLHSNKLDGNKIGYIELVKADTAFLFHSTRFKRMAYYDSVHTVQAKLVKTALNETKDPYIFCADLNSVPSGYVYHHIKEGIGDAFLQAGSGLGGTFHRFTFSLRIDVLLMSPHFKETQFYSPRPDLSDHYPLIGDIQVTK